MRKMYDVERMWWEKACDGRKWMKERERRWAIYIPRQAE